MSDSDNYASSPSPDDSNDVSDQSDSSEMFVSGLVEPYQDEPLGDSSDSREDNEEDEDGLTPAILRARYEGERPLDEWCKCDQCNAQILSSALEFRCCWEVLQARGKLTFDGSIERIKCITQHEDYIAMTNATVLNQASPFLKDKSGKTYRRRAGQSENQFLRAVAYRWLIRWICGYLGWDNSRPLPACIYKHIRMKFPSHQSRGYQSAQQRA